MGIVGIFEIARRGSRARVGALRGVGVVVAVVVVVLGGGVASAWAAGPEEPSAVSVGLISPTAVSLVGFVDPLLAPEPPVGGHYWFVYRASSTECKGGVQTAHGEYKGEGPGELAEEPDLTGLAAYTEYSVCLVAESEGQEAEGPVLTFRTPQAVEGPLTKPAVVLSPSSVRLSGVLRPSAVGKGEADRYAFRYAASASSCEGGETGEQTATGEPAQEVSTELAGLNPNTEYTACLVAKNDATSGPEGALGIAGNTVTFKTPVAAPTVTGTKATNVLAREATVAAEINPGGEASGYYLQYTPEASYQAKGWNGASTIPATGVQSIPALVSPAPVHSTLINLTPETSYRVQYVASNTEGGQSKGSETETTFTTLPAGTTNPALPDNRAYELVSTPASGEPYLPQIPGSWQSETDLGQHGTMTFQAAANGERMAYVAEAGEAGGIGAPTIGDQWIATRTATAWQPQNITPFLPNEGVAGEPIFQAFSPDLTTGIFEEPYTSVPLVSGVATRCRSLDTSNGFGGAKSLTALFTAGVSGGSCGNPLFAGESTDGTDIIFQSEATLTPGAQEATQIPSGHVYHRAEASIGAGCVFGCNLYEANGGPLRLVNEIEEHGAMVPVPNANFGGYGGEEGHFGGLPDFSRAISRDGSRVFWTDTMPEGGSGSPVEEVYVLEDDTREVKVSGPHSQYWTSTPDGHFAYYVEDEGEDTGRLYRFNTETNKPEELTHAGSGVIGVIGTNTTGEDGEYVYFVATGGKEVFGSGVEGQPNLYVLHNGTTSLVATAAGNDGNILVAENDTIKNASPWVAYLGFRQAEVSPDGRHMVFQTRAEPTGFPNEKAAEVYVFSAGSGGLVCVSCDAGGVPPGGSEGRSGKLSVSAKSYTYVHRWMSGDGNRVFFDTSQGLVPGDVNGVMDVYEWEREGVGSCPVRVPGSVVGGCQYLISGGQSEAASFFVDADESGDNVFFVHVGVLGDAQIPSGHLELYDARVDGGFPGVSKGCEGAGCSGTPPVAPVSGTGFAPVSGGYTGVGNYPPAVSKPPPPLTRAQHLAKALVVCRRDHVRRKRVACERLARKRYGPLKKKAKAGAKGGKASKAGSSGLRGSVVRGVVLVSSVGGVR
jgi:hypothetical protein